MENLDTSVHFPLLIHGENCCLFSEVWLCWGVCLWVCVLLRVSDAANCPFAVYPMGSGISLVTACSFSLNRPVAIAALQRTAPPPSAWRVTGQLEQGTVTCSLLWLQLWGERIQAGDTIHWQGPNKIHLQTSTMSQGPVGHEFSSCSTTPYLLWHLPSAAMMPLQRAQYRLHHPEGSGHISNSDRLIVLCYSASEIFITCHTHTALL